MSFETRPSVLIVEDERIIAKSVEEMLVGLGCDVTGTASTSEEAVARSSERCPDVVLMDIRIKGQRDGIATAETLWELFRTPVIYLTAQADDATVERAKHTRPSAYLTKPVKHAELRIAIDVALERRTLETSLRAALTEASRVNVELHQFAHAASHDVRASMRAIDSLSAWLEDDLKDLLNDEPREHLRLLRGRVSRMDRLLDDLLEYARAGQGGESVESVDTAIMLEQVSELTTFPPRFMFEIEPPMPILETARVPLQRVFMNLVSNAVKHHDRPNGRVRVSAQELGSFWSFVVSDDGPGIPPHFIAKAFQMFQTVRPRDLGEGSGMGLAFVKKVVEAGGGQISIECAARGTSVRFTWPKQWTRAAQRRDH